MRIIMHVDFDYFYAQCEELRDPSIKDKPVVVCVYSARGNDSGAVSTANYKAREYGVRSGIPIKFAKDRLKNTDAIFLPVDHDYYDLVSDKAMDIIKRYADKFEYVGDDEAYLDISSIKDFDKAKEIALSIKNEVKEKVGLSISIGIAPNKLLAKIASDYQKPNGLTTVKPEQVQEFIESMDVDKIIGIGRKTRARLNELGIKNIKDLRELNIYILTKEFGKKTGIYLYNASRGIDNEEVKEDESITQFSKIVTLKKNTNDIEEMLDDLRLLCDEIHKIVIENNYSFRNVGIMLVQSNMNIKSRSKMLKTLSSSKDELYKVAVSLLKEIMKDKPMVRRLGVKVSDLVSNKGQDTLLKFM